MNKVFQFVAVVGWLIFSGCGDSEQLKKNGNDQIIKQLNISILLDMSDRLVRPMTPPQKDRDKEAIKSLVHVYKTDMAQLGAYRAKSKIRILFHPAPVDSKINEIAKNLSVDLSKMKTPAEKKSVFDGIETRFEDALTEMYSIVERNNQWPGSDIWRFFKNDVSDLCIESDSTYRNVLVVVTDGYLFHNKSKNRIGNRTTYITSGLLREGLRNNSDWLDKLTMEDYGLIQANQHLENLEVIFLEINPYENHRDDEDIIKAYLQKWLTEMGVQSSTIYNTSLPENTKKRILDYFDI